ncbi:MAG: phosphate ABC transporter permease PstA [Spirochaetia bacterium]|jgi:phosphate transport system permease protein
MNRRRREEFMIKGLMLTSTCLVLTSLAGILLIICLKGIPAMSWSIVTKTAEGGFYLGKGGGILNAIIGSLAIAGGAVFIAFFLSVAVVLYLNVPSHRSLWYARSVRFCVEVLAGVPSIVYGAFGFTLMLYLGIRASLLGGIITVAILILPIMVRLMDEVASNVPRNLLEASLSLGASKWDTSFKVILRQSLPGVVTAILIAFGRGIGDAASVLFTAGFSDRIPTSLSQPVATLPLAVFFQLGSPSPEVRMKAYASALVLTAIILVISIGTRLVGRRLSRHTIK